MTERATEGTVRVVAAVVQRDGRYLLGRRPVRKRHGGLWEFPGGKLDPGESVLEAARRELAEELALTVAGIGELLLSVADGRSGFIIEFVEVHGEGEPVALEHEALGWFDPKEMRSMAFAPADAAFVLHLLGQAEPS